MIYTAEFGNTVNMKYQDVRLCLSLVWHRKTSLQFRKIYSDTPTPVKDPSKSQFFIISDYENRF